MLDAPKSKRDFSDIPQNRQTKPLTNQHRRWDANANLFQKLFRLRSALITTSSNATPNAYKTRPNLHLIHFADFHRYQKYKPNPNLMHNRVLCRQVCHN